MSKKHKKHHKSDKVAPEDKPGLKLVLKVGSAEAGDATPPPDEHDADKRHRHKKKKKKHKHHKDEPERKEKRKLEEMAISDTDDLSMDVQTPKRPAVNPAYATPDPGMTPVGGRSLRERKAVENQESPLQKCLDFFHKQIQRKDALGFFAFPVTDNIAPSYSKIIHNPMDMSTMGEKVEQNDYQSLNEFKNDFKLMCDNCMTYNHPETIYYKEAEKLLKAGLRLMSKEKVLGLKRNIPLFAMVSDADLGIDQDTGADGQPIPTTPKLFKPKIKKPAMTKFEAFPDRLTPEQILAQAQDAAKDASEQLTLRKPNTKFGFLRRRDDGSTTLNFLNPDNDGIVSDKERVVNLGTLVGKISNGTGQLQGFKEDKRNRALPVNYLNYGPYSTYAPLYDSSQANLNKEDSDLLLTAYGDEAGTQYAYSIRHFVGEAGDYALRMVDNLLDIITSGDHSKALGVLEKVEDSQKESAPEVNTEVKEEPIDPLPEIDYDSLRSLAELGIDTSFVDPMEAQFQHEAEVQQRLDTTSSLIAELQRTQYERLGQPLPGHLGQVSGPDDKEARLASKVTEGLKDLVKQAKPNELLSDSVMRDALGVTSPESDQSDASPLTVAPADTTTDEAHNASEVTGALGPDPMATSEDDVIVQSEDDGVAEMMDTVSPLGAQDDV